MLQFSVLASGSKGNCILVKSQHTKLLVDCGLSMPELKRRLTMLGETVEGIEAVLVTHEHSDHVGGAGRLASAAHAQVYMTSAAFQALPALRKRSISPRLRTFSAGDVVTVGDIEAESYGICHDAADPVNYVLRCEGAQLGIAIDLGAAKRDARTFLEGSHGLIVESNYDPTMLKRGNYPESVKARIMGANGHLSNDDAAILIAQMAHDGLQAIVVAHISETNNDILLAYKSATNAALRRQPVHIQVAEPDRPTPLLTIRATP